MKPLSLCLRASGLVLSRAHKTNSGEEKEHSKYAVNEQGFKIHFAAGAGDKQYCSIYETRNAQDSK